MESMDEELESEMWDHAVAMQSACRLHHKPNNEMPGSVAVDALLGSSDDLVVFFCGMRVFRNGVEFTLQARARPGASDDSGSEWLGDVMHGHRSKAGRLLLGIEFADGRHCTNLGYLDGCADNPDQPHLSTGGGGGDDESYESEYFLSPLPPPGHLRIVCAWPERGLPETITELSTDDILQAASRARELWPWEPRDRRRKAPPSPPPLPEGGWFAQRAAEVEQPPGT